MIISTFNILVDLLRMLGTFLSSLQISYHETVHRNIGLFKPLRDHNANIPLYTPTFGESINSVTQLQMHEALQSIEVHNLLKIMLNNLLGLASHNEFTETNHQHREDTEFTDSRVESWSLLSQRQVCVYTLGKFRCAILF